MIFFFHVLYGITLPVDELIFFRGVGQPPTSICCLKKHGFLPKNSTKPIHWGPQRALAVPSGRVLWAAISTGEFTFRNMDEGPTNGDFTDHEEVTRESPLKLVIHWWYPMGYFIESIQCKHDFLPLKWLGYFESIRISYGINRLFATSMEIRWPDRRLSGKNPIFAGFLRLATLWKTYWRGLKHLLGPQKHGGWPLKSSCFWRKCAETCMICTLLEIASESREDKEAQQNDFSLFSLVIRTILLNLILKSRASPPVNQ